MELFGSSGRVYLAKKNYVHEATKNLFEGIQYKFNTFLRPIT